MAHTLPPIEEIRRTAEMTNFDFESASQHASQQWRQEADEDIEMRDIVWPLEKVSSIPFHRYGTPFQIF